MVLLAGVQVDGLPQPFRGGCLWKARLAEGELLLLGKAAPARKTASYPYLSISNPHSNSMLRG